MVELIAPGEMMSEESPLNNPAERPGISIVVPVSRSRRTVERLIGSIEETVLRELLGEVQLILVGEPPEGVNSGNPALKIETIPVPEKHPGVRRNRGMARADHEVAALLDDDVLVTRSWFETVHREYHLRGYRGVLTGPSNLPYSGDFPERMSEALTNSPLSPFRSSHRTTVKKPVEPTDIEFCNCVLTRSLWSDIGGFDERGDWRIDDFLFACQARVRGTELLNHPGLRIAHRRGNFPLPYYRWVWYEKFHQAKVFVHYPFIFGWDRYFCALFLLTGGAAGLTAVFALRWLPWAAVAYLALAYVIGVKTGAARDLRFFLLTPPLQLVSYLAAGGGFYSGLVYGILTRRSVAPAVESVRQRFKDPENGDAV